MASANRLIRIDSARTTMRVRGAAVRIWLTRVVTSSLSDKPTRTKAGCKVSTNGIASLTEPDSWTMSNGEAEKICRSPSRKSWFVSITTNEVPSIEILRKRSEVPPAKTLPIYCYDNIMQIDYFNLLFEGLPRGQQACSTGLLNTPWHGQTARSSTR